MVKQSSKQNNDTSSITVITVERQYDILRKGLIGLILIGCGIFVVLGILEIAEVLR